MRVATATAIAEPDVQVAIRPECNVPAIVIGLGLVDLQDHLRSAERGSLAAILRLVFHDARHLLPAIAGGIGEIHARISGPARMKGHAQQAHLAAAGAGYRASRLMNTRRVDTSAWLSNA